MQQRNLLCVAFAWIGMAAPQIAHASIINKGFVLPGTIDVGSILPNYGIVSVGTTALLNINSGPIVGSVLVGKGSGTSSSGGGNGIITGFIDVSGSVSGDLFSSLQNPPVASQRRTLDPSVGVQAFDDAAALSADAAALAPTSSITSLSGTQTITGNGGLNVFNLTTVNAPTLTITGGPDDVFVFNVSSSFSSNHAMILNGVTAAQILWNLTGTGTVLSTSGGNILSGTFLATQPNARFQFSSLDLTGALINTGGLIQFVSNSSLIDDPFAPEVIPEPASLVLFGTGLASVVLARRRKQRV